MISLKDHTPDRVLVVTATVTAVATYALVVLGSTVRVTDSGMGCPDWPLCNGRLGPAGGTHALWEQSHRYVVVLVTVLVLATAALAWRRRVRQPQVARLLAVAVATLIAQAVLGAITVWTHNAPVTVALHLAFGMVLLALVVAAAVRSATPHRVTAAWRDRLSRIAVVTVFAVVVSGAVVTNADADTACPSWPLCSGHAARHLVALQLVHRGIVAVAVVVLAALSLRCWRRRADRADRWLGVALLIVLGAQVAAGAMVATRGATAAAQDLHLALGAAVWCVVVTMAARGRGVATGVGAMPPSRALAVAD
jgi:heme A synthase